MAVRQAYLDGQQKPVLTSSSSHTLSTYSVNHDSLQRWRRV